MAEGGESVKRMSMGAADRAAIKEVLMEVLGSLPAFRTVLAPDGGSGETMRRRAAVQRVVEQLLEDWLDHPGVSS